MEISENEYHTLQRVLGLIQAGPDQFARRGLASAGWRGCPRRGEKTKHDGPPELE